MKRQILKITFEKYIKTQILLPTQKKKKNHKYYKVHIFLLFLGHVFISYLIRHTILWLDSLMVKLLRNEIEEIYIWKIRTVRSVYEMLKIKTLS